LGGDIHPGRVLIAGAPEPVGPHQSSCPAPPAGSTPRRRRASVGGSPESRRELHGVNRRALRARRGQCRALSFKAIHASPAVPASAAAQAAGPKLGRGVRWCEGPCRELSPAIARPAGGGRRGCCQLARARPLVWCEQLAGPEAEAGPVSRNLAAPPRALTNQTRRAAASLGAVG